MNNVINGFPPLVLALLLAAILAAVVVCIVGFAKHGVNFLKYGFKQMALDASLEKRFDELGVRIESLGVRLDTRIDALGARLDARIDALGVRLDKIEVNHFGHLKSYLGVLNEILLDKNVIDNESRVRLDNELRDM
ncbi:MAG: hypothetical protein LBT00_14330 [Spirochaetaceae bacterium]|nr:hypothetical protein [Spirochaetaceae bacterium]